MDFKNTGLAKSTPCGGTVCLAVGPDGVHICDAIVLSANQNGSKNNNQLRAGVLRFCMKVSSFL